MHAYDPARSVEALRLLRNARAYLSEGHWRKHGAWHADTPGAYCAYGAVVNAAVPGVWERARVTGVTQFSSAQWVVNHTAGDLAMRALGYEAARDPAIVSDDPYICVFDFNDEALDLDEVLDLFDRAIQRIEDSFPAKPKSEVVVRGGVLSAV